MADSGSSSGFASQYGTNNMQLKRTTDNDIGVSSMVKTMKLDDPPVTPSTKPNLSGIKSSLHGISYQIKLCIFVCLANAKKALDPANKFSFTVVAEDPNAGKFDDIVYYFNDGDLKGSLKIQAKHKIDLKDEPIPRITLNDFMTDRDDNNPFALQKYFVSFYDQQLQTADVEGLIICTNSDIEDRAKHIWQPVDLGVTSSTSTPLDSYISSLFSKIGGTCFRLDYDKLMDGTLNDLYEMFKQCTKRTRLAKLLVYAIKSKEKITRRNALFKEYRLAILDIIDKNDLSKNGSYGFTKEFLDLSLPNSTPGYESFRKEFEEQYQKELRDTIKYHQNQRNKDKCGMENLKLKRLFVANDFFVSKTELSSLVSFPDDTADKSKLQTFCERFRLVFNTKNEDEVDELIVNFWWDLYPEGEQEEAGRRRGAVEESVAIEKLFKTTFDWLMNPYAKPLQSEDIKKDLKNITNRLVHIKLKGISEKLHMKLMWSPFRINPVALEGSDLNGHLKNEKLLEVEACNIQFGASLLIDLLAIQGKDLHNALLLDESDFTNNSDSMKELLRFTEQPIYLLIVCIESFKAVQSIVRRWKKDILNKSTRQVILIKKISSTPSDLNEFCVRDVTEDSWKQFLDENIPLCATTIPSAVLFQHNFQGHSIEDVIRQLDLGKNMGNDNEIMKKYLQIEHIYVQRYWIDQLIELNAENLDRSDRSQMNGIVGDIHDLKEKIVSFEEITERVKKHRKFDEIFEGRNKQESDLEPFFQDASRKVLILLGEAGAGKSTNLTWLAWHLWKQNPSYWVVRCNLSDHCTNFKRFTQDSRNDGVMIIDENEGLRMLYEMIHLSLVEMSNVDLQSARLSAHKCSTCLIFSAGQAILNEELMKKHGLSLNNTIQLIVFTDKFNAGQLVLFTDGFDEIAPHYKEVVMKFLSLFAQFDGVNRLYVTSRPYSFKEQFEEAFQGSLQYQLKPLTLQDKATMLYKAMRSKIHNENNDTYTSDFYKALCVMLIFSLADMSDIPLNLMMSVDIFVQLADRYINFGLKMVNLDLLEAIKDISKPSFIVEKFVEIKIQLIYCKIGAKADASDNPILIDDHADKLVKAKRQHGLIALWVLFDKSELELILSDTEIRKAKDYMKKILEATEKTGIVHGIQYEIPMFIHRTFAEYFAAWWIVKRQRKGERQGKIKICSLESFWKQFGLRTQLDRILAKRHPLHLAIIDREWNTVKSLLSVNPEAFSERDEGNRTPLHLLVGYRTYDPCFYSEHAKIEHDIINEKEILFGWTALDRAFFLHFHLFGGSVENSQIIFYLLQHGASINDAVLYEQIVSLPLLQVKIGLAAKYAKCVMKYLSREAIEYESHNVAKNMKRFCDKVAAYLVNETSPDCGRILDTQYISANENNELSVKKKSIVNQIIEDDSVWMLESVTRHLTDEERVGLMSSYLLFEFALKGKRVCVLAYFFENNLALMTEEIFRQCIAMSVIGDYKNEFKSFIDHYCCRMDIKYFQPCSIHKENQITALFHSFHDCEEKILNIFQMTDLLTEKGKVTIYNISSEIEIDTNILSVMIICVILVRPLMLNYIKESLNLKHGVSLVYYLARVTDCYMKELEAPHNRLSRHSKFNRLKSAFNFLLDQTLNISNVEVNEILRLAITSDLFTFSKYLIERYDVSMQTIDELNGWNILHLCVSRPRSADDYVEESLLELFRYLLYRTDIDSFGNENHSILYQTIENGHESILDCIVARKLGLNHLNEIESLGIDAIPYLSFCFRAIYDVSKCVGKKACYQKILCTIAKQIANISLTIHDKLNQQSNSGVLLLQENAQELYHFAINCRSISLMHYLHRKFHCKFPLPIDDADWLELVRRSLNTVEFQLFQWIVRQYCVAHYINHPTEEADNEDIVCDVVKDFDADTINNKGINLEKLVKEAEAKLSDIKSKEDVCILKLIILATCLKHESAIRYLCETFSFNIDQKILFDVMEIAHEIGKTNSCTFHSSNFEPIYRYLIERATKFHEIDAEGRNMFHLAAESGPNCMIRWLFEHNMIKTPLINEKNGWNFFHYYASRKPNMDYCFILQRHIFRDVLKGVLKNDELTIQDKSLSRLKQIKEICFKSEGARKSVIHVAIEGGHKEMVEYIIRIGLGINGINDHKLMNEDECSRFKECFDVINRIAIHLPFNAGSEELLDKLAKPIDSFLLINIKHATKQTNLKDHDVEDFCRAAIKYRSVSTLEYLMKSFKHQMIQIMAGSNSREIVACMMECIRRNKTCLFTLLVGDYQYIQGIKPDVEETNDGNADAFIKESRIQWSVLDEVTQDEPTKREYIPLLILLFVYGRLSMTISFVEMLQLVVTKPMILLLMKATNNILNCERRIPVYEYLTSLCEEKSNLLHLCAQVRDTGMVRYLVNNKLLDPCEIDSGNGWNAGHYCVSEPPYDITAMRHATDILQCLMKDTNLDCFGVHDISGRSVLHLAMENFHTQIVEYIIKHRLGISRPTDIRQAWKIKKVDECIGELQRIKPLFPDSEILQNILQKLSDRKQFLTSLAQAFYCFP